jgi:pantetheine-phosphate adenylyltransferase
MRVIAGRAKGRRLKSPPGHAVRPTADRIKEALFSTLLSRFELQGTLLLDLFAGSGALGIEALSRGAERVVFVEQHRATTAVLRANLTACGFLAAAEIVTKEARPALAALARTGRRFDGVLADPPYGQGLVHASLCLLSELQLIAPGGWVMVERHVDELLRDTYGTLQLTQIRRYGKTCLALYCDQVTPSSRFAEVKRKAVYAGSFDPITKGHLDIVRRALEAFDEIVIAVAHNPSKDSALFTAAERVAMICEALADVAERVTVDAFQGLLVDYCDRVGASAIIRGLRAVSDFEYEFQMAMMNRHLNSRVETFFMTAGESYFYTASRLVKEVASLGGDVSGLVPPGAHRRLLEKFGRS